MYDSCQFKIFCCLSCQLHIRLKPIKTFDYRPWKHQEWPKEGAFGVFALTATEPMGEKPLCPAKSGKMAPVGEKRYCD